MPNMTPRQLAIVIADELIEELERMAGDVEAFCDRYGKYANQFDHLIPAAKRLEVDQACDRYAKRMKSCSKRRPGK